MHVYVIDLHGNKTPPSFSPPNSNGEIIKVVASVGIDGDCDLIAAGDTFGWLEKRPA